MQLLGSAWGRWTPTRRSDDSAAVETEAYRILRTNLIVALADVPHPTVMITSAHAGEGKTSVAANLAASLAADGRSVGLLDLDLRRPSIHQWFNLANESGASDVLLEQRSLDECLHHLRVETGVRDRPGNLHVLTAGRAVQQPTELLNSITTSRLLEDMTSRAPRILHGDRRHDVVVIDTPPVLPVADALVLGRVVSGAILVVEAGSTQIGAAQQAKDALIRNQTRLIGVVLNSRSREHDVATAYGYGYGYGPTDDAAGNA